MCDPDLRPLCMWVCVCAEISWRKAKVSQKNKLDLLSLFWGHFFFYAQTQVRAHDCFRQHRRAEAIDWMIPFSPWVMGQGSQTAHSHLISAQPFPRPNTSGAPGKWERNITFPLRLRGMWHSVDGFCRTGSARGPSVLFFFFLLKQECRLVNWLVLIRPVQVPITARPQRSWTEIALLW